MGGYNERSHPLKQARQGYAMKLNYVPLLKVQRELQGIPRGLGRFQQYLRTMLTKDGTDLELVPLVIMNPMGKDHVTTMLDTLLTMEADRIAADSAAEASIQSADIAEEFSASLVVADDLLGGGTNRYAYEYDLRFGPERLRHRSPNAKGRSWISGILWTSEVPTERTVREAMFTAVYRTARRLRHGPARTLRERLAQEGDVLAMAGCGLPAIDEGELRHTREVLASFLDAEDMPTTIECLFGDSAASSLGYTPRGLAPWAGLALALHDAQALNAARRGS